MHWITTVPCTQIILCAAMLLTLSDLHAQGANRKYNSATKIEGGTVLADVDGDGKHEFVTARGRTLEIRQTSFRTPRVLAHTESHPIMRVIPGRFVSSSRDALAVVLNHPAWQYPVRIYSFESGRLRLRGNDRGVLNKAGRRYIVGRFTQNARRDEILVHNTGARHNALRLYRVWGNYSQYFEDVSGFSLGNLVNVDLRNKTLFAGDFGQETGRDDLLVVDKANGQLSRYDTAPRSNVTFWFAWRTRSGLFDANSRVLPYRMANRRDGVFVWNSALGAQFYTNEWVSPGFLRRLPGHSYGNIDRYRSHDRDPRRFLPVFASVHASLRDPRSSDQRDDILIFEKGSSVYSSYAARFNTRSSLRHTFWWAFTTHTPSYLFSTVF